MIDPRLTELGIEDAPEAEPAVRAQKLHELGFTGAEDTPWINAVSTNVAAFRWVPGDPYPLQVRFLDGAEYGYLAPEVIYDGILFAPSKGGFLHHVLVKGGYPYLRLR
jgi:hypothetical protein